MDNENEYENIEWSRILDGGAFIRIRKGDGAVTLEIGALEDGPEPDQDQRAVVKATVAIDVDTAYEMALGLGDAADRSLSVIDKYGGIPDHDSDRDDIR